MAIVFVNNIPEIDDLIALLHIILPSLPPQKASLSQAYQSDVPLLPQQNLNMTTTFISLETSIQFQRKFNILNHYFTGRVIDYV